MFHADGQMHQAYGQTDRQTHDEANNRFSQFLQRRLKMNAQKCMISSLAGGGNVPEQ